MFRSVSEDARDENGAKPGAASFGRRRTRAQAKLEINERRERLRRTREAMEAMTRLQSTPVKVGASFGESLAIERTPTKREARSPPAVRRAAAPHVAVPTPEKAVLRAASEATESKTATVSAVMSRRAMAARGIAQSSSSNGSSRKRMISFSPERAERPINEEAERQKRQRNLKATEKLQLRLEGIPTRTPEKPELPPNLARKSPTQRPSPQQPAQTTPSKPRAASPTTASVSNAREAPVVPSPTLVTTAAAAETLARSDTPDSQLSNVTLELHSDDGEDRAPSRTANANPTSVSCKKELDFTATDEPDVKMETAQEETQPQDVAAQEAESQNDVAMSQFLEASAEELDAESTIREEPATPQHTIGFGGEVESSISFTSTSTIEDVGLFNCETDVEFTGGVYGEGTDGKVSAAMVRGQKVALKHAKPHDGFPEEEAKRRSAIELHYLRRVRHVQGFVQCLGLCDGIEHTCIALEVMDCKLSDYLRRYGRQSRGSGSSSKRRCYTLSLDATRSILRQICLPMMELHDRVNVAHGDLACRNILLRLPPKGYEQKWEPVVKLSDFGRIKTPSSEPTIFGDGFSFYKNCDVGSFAREILYRLLVGEIVPTNCTETRSLHKHLQDVVVERIPEQAKEKLGPYYRLFMRCAEWGVRPTFREIVEHLDDLEYFETSENGFFPLKPSSASTSLESASFLSPIMDAGRNKAPSSGSKNKYETPATANSRGIPTTAPAASNPNVPGVQLLQSKSFTDGPPTSQQTGTTTTMKTVNWLKARSVHPGQGNQQPTKPHLRPANPAMPPTNPATSAVTTTPNKRPSMPKKTPPSAGASRRSLQILNQIQHRIAQTEKDKKKC